MTIHDFGSPGDFICENQHILIHLLHPKERDLYFSALIAQSELPEMYQFASFCDFVWQEVTTQEITFSLIEKDSGQFFEFCNLRDLNADIPEFGISLLPAFRHKGLGQQAVQLVLHKITESNLASGVLLRIYNDNVASLALFRHYPLAELRREPSQWNQFIQSARASKQHDSASFMPQSDDRFIIVYKLSLL